MTRYWVDWRDTAFPAIKVWFFGEGAEYAPTPLTLRQAKDEIIEHFRYDIQHARMMIRDTKALRGKDFGTLGIQNAEETEG